MSDNVVCSSCGNSLGSGYRFCPRCGNPCAEINNTVNSQTQSQPSVQQPNSAYTQQPYQNYGYTHTQNYTPVYRSYKYFLLENKIRQDCLHDTQLAFCFLIIFSLAFLGTGIALLVDEPEAAWPLFGFFIVLFVCAIYHFIKILSFFRSGYNIYCVPCIDRSIEDDGESTFFILHLKDPFSFEHKYIYPVTPETYKYTNVGDLCYIVIFNNDKSGKKLYPEKYYQLSPELQAKLKVID